MVQGLAFLSKKSWHTKNLANQERVWIEEQKKAAEDSKTQELAKQIQREREEEDLDRIAGRKSNRLDKGIDWMYQGVKSDAAQEDAKKQAEEYLLGKEFTGGPSLQIKGDLAQALEQNDGVNAVISNLASDRAPVADHTPSSQIPVMSEPSVAERNEAFRVRLEDPMYFVRQKRREQEVKVEKTKALYEKVVAKSRSDDDDNRKLRKREKKERKRERKRQREEGRSRRRRSPSASRSDSESDVSRRARSRSGRMHERSPESCRDDTHAGNYIGRQQKIQRREFQNHLDDRRHCNDNARSVTNSQSFDYGHSKSRFHQQDRHREDIESTNRSGRFGLQGSSKIQDFSNLGPSADLISQRQKRQEPDYAQKMKPDRRRMTQEEREEALRRMQLDAIRHDVIRQAKAPPDQEEVRKSAAFLHKMAQETHGVRGTQKSLAERIAQNRHKNQRPDDLF